MLCSLSSWSEFTLCLYLLFALSISQLELLREPSVMWCYQEGMILQNVCYIYDDIFNIFIVFRAIHNMNTWYPDATPEELENTDNVCIICREEMQAPSTKKLPCNHIFHKNCLRSWFQRQQTCPTCRLDVLRCFRTLKNSNAHFTTFRFLLGLLFLVRGNEIKGSNNLNNNNRLNPNKDKLHNPSLNRPPNSLPTYQI